MHLVGACGWKPLKVASNTMLAPYIRHPHYFLIQQPAADWEHLHEGPQLLVLLQQLRQVLTAYVRRPGGPHLRRDSPRGGEACVRTVQAVHGGARRPGGDGAAPGCKSGEAATGGGRRGEEEEKRRGWRGYVFIAGAGRGWSRWAGTGAAVPAEQRVGRAGA